MDLFRRHGWHSRVSCSYCGMFWGQISMYSICYLPSKHPIIAFWNNRIQNGRRVGKKVYLFVCPRQLSLCHVVHGEDWVPVSRRVGPFCSWRRFYPLVLVQGKSFFILSLFFHLLLAAIVTLKSDREFDLILTFLLSWKSDMLRVSHDINIHWVSLN